MPRTQFLPVLIVFLISSALAQRVVAPSSKIVPIPEMTRLSQALGGDWNNHEIMEPSDQFPKGAQRRGTSHCELSTGGTTILCEGSSDGTAGKLDHLIVIWWDSASKNYGFFVCFKDRGADCQIRGTAHWKGEIFVNDYSDEIKGKTVKMRDSFVDITPNSHTLVAAIETSDGKMKTLITTRSTRR